MYDRYYTRQKSSLTAERVKTDPCFAVTMYQASIMAQASRIGSAAYLLIPAFCKEYKHYRLLTGKANLMLKKGLHEDEIIMRLIEKYIVPIRRQALREARKEQNRQKRKRNRQARPAFLRPYRRLRMVTEDIEPALTLSINPDAVDQLLRKIFEDNLLMLSPPLTA